MSSEKHWSVPTAGHPPAELASVAQWLGCAVSELVLKTVFEPISQFASQIESLLTTYPTFPKEAARTRKVQRLLQAGEAPWPVYIDEADGHNFIMEGRHRIVAMHLLGLKYIPVCRVLRNTPASDTSAL